MKEDEKKARERGNAMTPARAPALLGNDFFKIKFYGVESAPRLGNERSCAPAEILQHYDVPFLPFPLVLVDRSDAYTDIIRR